MTSNEPHPLRPPRQASAADTVQQPLVSLLAQAARPSELLPHLHQQAVERAGGQCSLLFQHNPRNGALHATSGFGLDTLRTDPWIPSHDEAIAVASAFERGTPLLVADAAARMPDLAGRLGTSSALLLPLARSGERVGLLAVGL